jgi:DNA-directed RNA polymerase subunit N (RpoN/RPB10)
MTSTLYAHVMCSGCGKRVGSLQSSYETLVAQGLPIEEALTEIGLARYCCRSTMMSMGTVVEPAMQLSAVEEIRGGRLIPSRQGAPSDVTRLMRETGVPSRSPTVAMPVVPAATVVPRPTPAPIVPPLPSAYTPKALPVPASRVKVTIPSVSIPVVGGRAASTYSSLPPAPVPVYGVQVEERVVESLPPPPEPMKEVQVGAGYRVPILSGRSYLAR